MNSSINIAAMIVGPLAALGVLGVMEMSSPQSSPRQSPFRVPIFTQEADAGRHLYVNKCSACHGVYGEGSVEGPPLVHPVYAPDRLDANDFHKAIVSGVTARRWPLGDMMPVAGVDRTDADRLYTFLRELQQANGIN